MMDDGAALSLDQCFTAASSLGLQVGLVNDTQVQLSTLHISSKAL